MIGGSIFYLIIGLAGIGVIVAAYILVMGAIIYALDFLSREEDDTV